MNNKLPESIRPLYDSIVKRFNKDLTEIEERTLQMLCWSAYVHQDAVKTIAETGLLVKSPRGAIIHPLVRIAKEEADTFIKLSNQLNLKPNKEGESFDLWDKLAKEIMH